jgi:hypothetical protein
LALDINFFEGSVLSGLKNRPGFAGKELDTVISLLEKGLAIVVANKLCGVGVRFETKLLRNEAKFNVWLISIKQLVMKSKRVF